MQIQQKSGGHGHRITLMFISVFRTVFAFGELLIMVRIIFDFLKASSEALFVQWVNAFTNPLLQPFVGTFPPYELESGFVIQTHAVLAFVVYAFVGYLLVQGITLLGSHKNLFTRSKTY